ncbi:restriction endonuclease subunit S [Vibrio hyugaensis]|uniref:restriction endonuclease subunit S n=1 Tax=Vibrio hyugaensis TaxID=1534743 RepID=UPI0015E35AB9|nr:restriction endonuclease subunit S [Vibrio hyugaensis]
MVNNLPWPLVSFETLLAEPLRNGIYKKKEFHGRGCKIVNMGELFKYPRLNSDVEMNLVELSDKEKEKSLLKTGDLIFARRSLTAEGAGKCTLIYKISEDTTFESSIIRARLDPNKALPEFYYYLFNSPIGKWLLGTILRQTAVAGITGSDLAKLMVPCPPISLQKELVEHARVLDNKIDINSQIKQTLEQMAQTLFKSWFVDFDPVIDNALDAGNPIPELFETRVERRKAVRESADFKPLPDDVRQLFPSEFEESELGWVPKGWMVQYSGGIFDVRDGTHDSPKKSEDGFPLVTSRHLTSGNLDLSSAYLISEDDYDKVNKRSKVDHGDILLTMIGTVGVSYLVNVAKVNFAIKNVGLFKTSVTPELRHYFYQMLRSKETTSFLESRVAGTTQKYLSLKVLRNIPILLPCSTLLKIFNSQVEPYSRLHQFNLDNTSSLSKFRDTLLPKLISGELRLDSPEVEQAKALVE